MVHLTSIKQLNSKTIKDYMKRFTEAARQVQDFNEVEAVMAFIQGLHKGHLSWSLSEKGPITYRELIERAEKYATSEDISDSKGLVTSAESSETLKRCEKQSRDNRKKPQASRQVNTGSTL
ncbi:hypothetical protein LWI28_019765 [Acer negundo]|uniref:Retrotransposon gag domain-containing protein n=1 Tax=Acer negundo TaxID=4023 RepID=A0AAD5JDV9_ACENE|nr:hypothetical protein LWI28_019765 [Acer negundo]